MEQKSYTRRDSATAYLRKVGIDKVEYDQYILIDGGEFHLNFLDGTLVKHSAAVITAHSTKIAETPPTDKAVNAAKLKGLGVRTVSSVCRMMVKAGRTNEQIWLAIKKEFGLGDNKKHYPAWYRSEVTRKGL